MRLRLADLGLERGKMKFKIRHADTLVGIFSLLAVAGLIFGIIFIGLKQDVFTKKNYYYAVFDTGEGMAPGMDITYKGFSIGKIKSVSLEGWMVRVDFYVLGKYEEYVKENSLVEFSAGIAGFGTSFVFYPGVGPGLIPTNSEIYRLDSGYGKKIISERKNFVMNQDDSIAQLVGKVSRILDDVSILVNNFNGAMTGSVDSELTQIFKNLNKLSAMLGSEKGTIPGILGPEMTRELTSMLSGLAKIFTDEKGAMAGILGDETAQNIVELMENLTKITVDLSGVTANADNLMSNMTPEIDGAIKELNRLLIDVDDVLEGVKNLPLIRNGVPDRSNESSASVQIRSADF